MALLTRSDLTTALYDEIIEVITRADDSLVSRAISNAEEEAKAYLNRFNKTLMFGGSYSNQLLKYKVADIAVWQIIKLGNPNINLELSRTIYKDALTFFEKVMNGKIEPEWPLRVDDDGSTLDERGHIFFTSNPKKIQHY